MSAESSIKIWSFHRKIKEDKFKKKQKHQDIVGAGFDAGVAVGCGQALGISGAPIFMWSQREIKPLVHSLGLTRVTSNGVVV